MEDGATKAMEDVAAGRPIILLDDFRGLAYLAVAAEKAAPGHINLMARYARGIVAIVLEASRLAELDLPVLTSKKSEGSAEPFTMSVDAKRDGASGISARDRAATIKALIDPATKPEDLVRPGHLFPIRYSEGGLFTTPRAPEALVDLSRLAGLYPAGVLCAIMSDTGDMMSEPIDLNALGTAINARSVRVSEVMRLRGQREKVVKRVASAHLPTQYGEFTVVAYDSLRDADEHIALIMGDPVADGPMPAAFVNGCVAGHVFDNQACQCGTRLDERLSKIGELKRGVILYTPVFTVDKHLGDGASPRPPLDERIWLQIVGTQVLADLGVRRAAMIDDGTEIEVPQPSTP